MDNSDPKKALKEAKEAVKNKEFQTALEHCKVVLKADKSSYLGLVLSAVCFQELGQPDKAIAAFTRATDLQPNQLTAWQGFAAFLEQERSKISTDPDSVRTLEERTLKLEEIYTKLVELYNGDVTKQIGVWKKQCNLYASRKEWENCEKSAKELLEKDSEKDTQLLIANLLFQQENLSASSCEIVETALNRLVELCPEDKLELYKKLLRVKLTKKDYPESLHVAQHVLQISPLDKEALEAVCRVFVVDRSCGIDTENANSAAEQVSAALPNSLFANLAKASVLIKTGSILEARNLLQKVLNKNQASSHGIVLLCEVYDNLQDWQKLEETCSLALKNANEESMKLEEWYVKALLEQNNETKLQIAAEVCTNLGSTETDSSLLNIFRARCLLRRDDFSTAESLLGSTDLHSASQIAILNTELLLKKKQNKEALSFLKQSADRFNEDVDFLIFSAKTLWDLQHQEEAVEYFLKALKVNSSLKEPYVHLGLYYAGSNNRNSLLRGLKCFQKAFQLDSTCLLTAEAQSDLHIKLDDTEGHLKLLEFVTARFNSKEAKWAWLRKAVVHLQQARDSEKETEREKRASEAVFCFQNVLRADPTNRCCWEALGDAYSARNSFSSALKAFQKALALDENSIYAAYQLAEVEQNLGETESAVKSYRSVLERNPDYVPALKGLAETLLGQAKTHQENGFTGRTVDCCSEALTLLVRAAHLKPNFAALWSLMGQSCVLVANIPEQQFCFTIPEVLGAPQSGAMTSKARIMELGKQFYIKALQISPDCSSLWHNLALCYKASSQTCPGSEVDQNLAAALTAAKKAVSLSPDNESHWNLLGVVASSPGLQQAAVAQHAFIRAAEVNSKSSTAWTNLGVLYYDHERLHLAHEAFKKSQNADPFYVRAWIGQAHIAEQLKPSEAMDLFRHTLAVGSGIYGEIEGSVAYAQWVISTLLDPTVKDTQHYRYSIVQMHAIATAIDALVKYVAIFPDDPCAQNLLGLLYERQKLYRNAEAAFAIAREILERSKSNEGELQKVQANLARIYTVTGRPALATELYASLQDSELSTACGVALAHFKAGRFAEAFVTYQATLDWLASDDAIRSHLHVAMASCAFRRDCRQSEVAATLLFQSCQMEPPSVYGLMALAALGLLTEDPTLTEAAFQEIAPYVSEKRYAADIAFLMAYSQLTSADASAALKEVARVCHMLPSVPQLWMQMSTFLASTTINAWKANPSDGARMARYAEIAAGVARQFGNSQDEETLDIAHVEALTSMGDLLAGYDKTSLIAAQKAVHCSPASAAPWSVLLASASACWKQSSLLDKQKILWLKQLIGHLRRNCDVAAFSGLAPWLGGYEKRFTSLLGQA